MSELQPSFSKSQAKLEWAYEALQLQQEAGGRSAQRPILFLCLSLRFRSAICLLPLHYPRRVLGKSIMRILHQSYRMAI